MWLKYDRRYYFFDEDWTLNSDNSNSNNNFILVSNVFSTTVLIEDTVHI